MIERQHPTGEEFLSYCSQCQRAFPKGRWFARFWRSGRWLEFCRPRCVELFLGSASSNGESRKEGDLPIRWNLDGYPSNRPQSPLAANQLQSRAL